MKCDKLKPYTYDDMIDGDADTNIEYYPKSDADAAIAELKHTIDELVVVKKSAELILQNLLDCGLIKEWYFNGKFNAVLKADGPHLKIAELKTKLQDQCISCHVKMQEDAVIAEYQEKILVLEKSYKKLVKKFVHETSVAESYRSLVYKDDALKYQKVGNAEMYEELSKRSDKSYRHANRWRRIFRKMSQEDK